MGGGASWPFTVAAVANAVPSSEVRIVKSSGKFGVLPSSVSVSVRG
jgi:hypothetical protein